MFHCKGLLVSFCGDHKHRELWQEAHHQVSDEMSHRQSGATSKSLDHREHGWVSLFGKILLLFFLWLKSVKLQPNFQILSWMDYASRMWWNMSVPARYCLYNHQVVAICATAEVCALRSLEHVHSWKNRMCLVLQPHSIQLHLGTFLFTSLSFLSSI